MFEKNPVFKTEFDRSRINDEEEMWFFSGHKNKSVLWK